MPALAAPGRERCRTGCASLPRQPRCTWLASRGRSTEGIADLVRPKILEQFKRQADRSPAKSETPLTCFNGDIGSDRGFVFGSLSLDDIKTVRKAFDVSVNDVLLALVSTALRHYLLARDELPQLSLRTGIPISLRSDEDEEISNRVTQASVTLATDVADPVARLRAISAGMRRRSSKSSAAAARGLSS